MYTYTYHWWALDLTPKSGAENNAHIHMRPIVNNIQMNWAPT